MIVGSGSDKLCHEFIEHELNSLHSQELGAAS